MVVEGVGVVVIGRSDVVSKVVVCARVIAINMNAMQTRELKACIVTGKNFALHEKKKKKNDTKKKKKEQ